MPVNLCTVILVLVYSFLVFFVLICFDSSHGLPCQADKHLGSRAHDVDSARASGA